ncbi:MAG: DUF4238 domain-containing protein [Kiritimatiellae bacterium]|nr:DUF4238 domain-containing protein [Kiritimatiellia bacterium]
MKEAFSSDENALFDEEQYKVKTERIWTIREMIRLAKENAFHLSEMDWEILYAPPNKTFLTTDDPFFMQPPKDHPKSGFYSGFSILTPGAVKILPLSATACLIMHDECKRIVYRDIDSDETRQINLCLTDTCYQMVISRDEQLGRKDGYRQKRLGVAGNRFMRTASGCESVGGQVVPGYCKVFFP